MEFLREDRRNQLIAQSQHAQREKGDGKTRYEKRIKSRIATTVAQYNRIDMNKLFRDNILDVDIKVAGETGEYTVRISFGGFLDEIKEESERNGDVVDLRTITRALINSFNSDNVYLRCDCPDAKYRFNYWQSKKDIIIGTPETRPSKITNPDNTLGAACKHVLLVLANHTWLLKVASVVNNYIKYFKLRRPQQYADIIYPAIFRKRYGEPVQTSIYDKDILDSDEEVVDISNREGRVSGRFKSKE